MGAADDAQLERACRALEVTLGAIYPDHIFTASVRDDPREGTTMTNPIIHDSINAVGVQDITEPGHDGRRFRVTIEHFIDGNVIATGPITVTISPYEVWAAGDDVVPQVLATVEAWSDDLPNDGHKFATMRAVDRYHFSEPKPARQRVFE